MAKKERKHEPLFSPRPPTDIAKSVREGVGRPRNPMWGKTKESEGSRKSREDVEKRKRDAVKRFTGK